MPFRTVKRLIEERPNVQHERISFNAKSVCYDSANPAPRVNLEKTNEGKREDPVRRLRSGMLWHEIDNCAYEPLRVADWFATALDPIGPVGMHQAKNSAIRSLAAAFARILPRLMQIAREFRKPTCPQHAGGSRTTTESLLATLK